MTLNRFFIKLKLDSFLFWLKYKSPAAGWTQTKEVTGQAFLASGIKIMQLKVDAVSKVSCKLNISFHLLKWLFRMSARSHKNYTKLVSSYACSPK